MAKVIYQDSLIVITGGTVTVANTTYPLSGVLSFSVTYSGNTYQDWPKTRYVFCCWLLIFSAVAGALMFFFLSQYLPFWVFYILLMVAGFGAWWATLIGDYTYWVIERWYLSIDTKGRSESLLSSNDEAYIRSVATHLGSAMAER